MVEMAVESHGLRSCSPGMRPTSALSSAYAWPSRPKQGFRELLTRFASSTLSFLSVENKNRYRHFLFFMVEMASRTRVRIISAKLSPSAVNDFLLRLSRRPLTDTSLSYPVVPLCYRELAQSFPVYSMPDFKAYG